MKTPSGRLSELREGVPYLPTYLGKVLSATTFFGQILKDRIEI
jgi:hypothetical protein